MSFHYVANQLQIENLFVKALAEQYGTPCYIYSDAELTRQWQAFHTSLSSHSHQIHYAVKANSNLSILARLAKLGAGFDIVSGGELVRVIKAGGDPRKTVFSGVGKRSEEIKQALEAKIGCFNVESYQELIRIREQATRLKTIAPIALRINPNIDAKTHPYITTGLQESKFGISEHDALAFYRLAAQSSALKIQGITCHLGSQLTTLQPFLEALEQLLKLSEQLAKEGIHLTHINIGGGLGVSYQGESTPSIQEYCAAILQKLSQKNANYLCLWLEPGRVLMAKAGILVTRIEYIKQSANKNFAIVDAGMNDFLRPALYQAQQTIWPVAFHHEREEAVYDVVGPICESSDFLGKAKSLAIQPGDYLAILDSGAYGFSMSSNYNSRPRCAEILVDKGEASLIRSHETLGSRYAHEKFWPSCPQN